MDKIWAAYFSAYLLAMVTFAVFKVFLQLIQFLSMFNYPTLFHSLSLNQRHKFSLLHWYICLFLYTMFVLLHSMKSTQIYISKNALLEPLLLTIYSIFQAFYMLLSSKYFLPSVWKKINYLGGKIKYFDFIYWNKNKILLINVTHVT